MQEILEFLGFDIFTVIIDFIDSIQNFIGSILNFLLTFVSYTVNIHPVIFALFMLGLVFSVVFGILKLINLLPF